MISKYMKKGSEQLELNKIEIGHKLATISFKNSKSTILVDLGYGILDCSCYFSANHNKNKDKLCKHKVKVVKEIMEINK